MSSGRVAAGRRGRSRGGGHAQEHENHERWMVPYADMLTLLLVLFIVLYAISQVNTSKFAELKSSLSSAFGNGQSPILNGGKGPIEGTTVSVDQNIVDSKLSIPKQQANSPQKLNLASNADADAALRELDEFKKIEQAIKA